MNFDTAGNGTTTINTEIKFVEKPTQNDGGTGQDAGDSYVTSSQLAEGNINSSGILICDDQSDFYSFGVIQGKNLTITFSGFDESNCDFILYKQGGIKVIEETDVIDSITLEYSANESLTLILSISKSDANDFAQVDYQFYIDGIQSELTSESPIKTGYIFGAFSLLCIAVIIMRTRKKERN